MKQLMMTIIFVMAATNWMAQTDSTTVKNDSITWSQELEGVEINFSLSYRFGKLKASVKKTETTIDNDDVVGGISKGK